MVILVDVVGIHTIFWRLAYRSINIQRKAILRPGRLIRHFQEPRLGTGTNNPPTVSWVLARAVAVRCRQRDGSAPALRGKSIAHVGVGVAEGRARGFVREDLALNMAVFREREDHLWYAGKQRQWMRSGYIQKRLGIVCCLRGCWRLGFSARLCRHHCSAHY